MLHRLALLAFVVGCSGPAEKKSEEYTVAVDPPTIFMRRGETQMVSVQITRTSGMSPIDVTVDGLPNGVTADPLTITDTSGMLVLHASASANEGAAMLTVHGTVSTIVSDATMHLLVGDAPGTLDLSFAGTGKFVANVPGMVVVGRALVLQNGIVVTGSTGTQQITFKLTDNGMLDPSFGSNGLVSTGSGNYSEGIAITTLADNRVIVAGIGNGMLSMSDADFGVFAYSPTGVLDTTFGASGVATYNPGAGIAEVHAVALTSDGKLITSGTLFPTGAPVVGIVKRWSTTGALDMSFNVVEMGVDIEANAVQPDGKLVVAGDSGNPFSFWLARYNVDGTRDTGFGTGGVVTTSFAPDSATASGLIPVAGGKFVAIGVTSGANQHIVIARYNANGSLDLSFGVGGVISTAIRFGTRSPSSALVDAAGHIVMVGIVNNLPSVVRLNADGTPDMTFGTAGVASVDFGITGTTGNTSGFGLAIDSDGRILFTGEVGAAGNQHGVVARLWP